MSIDDYLRLAKKTRADLAQAAGCSVNHMHQVARGERTPSPRLAARIVAASAGAVTMDDLYRGVVAEAS